MNKLNVISKVPPKLKRLVKNHGIKNRVCENLFFFHLLQNTLWFLIECRKPGKMRAGRGGTDFKETLYTSSPTLNDTPSLRMTCREYLNIFYHRFK